MIYSFFVVLNVTRIVVVVLLAALLVLSSSSLYRGDGYYERRQLIQLIDLFSVYIDTEIVLFGRSIKSRGRKHLCSTIARFVVSTLVTIRAQAIAVFIQDFEGVARVFREADLFVVAIFGDHVLS